MKIGVVSDTHRNAAFLEKVVNRLSSKEHIAALYHLGDDFDDVINYADSRFDIVQVPGVYHPGYRDGSLEAKRVETVLGLRIMLVHSLEKDFSDEDRMHADIVLHGHTHRPEILLEDGFLYFNPGHLKGPMDKNTPPSFGILEVQEKNVEVKTVGLDFEEIDAMSLGRSEGGLYRID